MLKEQEGSISIKELSAATMIKTEDIISTLQHLNLIQYQKGQHVICAAPAVIEKTLKQAGSPGLKVPSLPFSPICRLSLLDISINLCIVWCYEGPALYLSHL